jgi:MFS family permease
MAGYMRLLTFGVPFEAFTKDIWLICLSNVIGAFGEGLYSYIFPIYVGKLQADYFQIGAVISALFGASALTPLPGGWLADRFDRKKILILSWIPWFIAPLFYSAATHWTLLIPGTICWGISMIGVPALNACIITSVRDKKKLTSVFSFVWASYSFSYIFAPATGALLASFIGMRFVFLVSSVLCAAATGVFLFLHSQHPRKRNQEAPSSPALSSAEQRRL